MTIPPAAHFARGILSMAFGWVFLRGWQLRDEIISPPENASTETVQLSLNMRGSNQVSRKTTIDEIKAEAPFSACLLVRQEDFRLSEWLAYNSFVLHLEYLVVSFDPSIRSDQHEILERYHSELGMTTILWSESDYIDEDTSVAIEESLMAPDRQQLFMEKCAVHMQHQNRAWVTFQDSDDAVAHLGDLSANDLLKRHVAAKNRTGDDEKLPDWMHGFIDKHGMDKASRLLNDVR